MDHPKTQSKWLRSKRDLSTKPSPVMVTSRQMHPSSMAMRYREWTAYADMIKYYNNTKSMKPSLYEVMTSSSDIPVFLYIDFDYSTALQQPYDTSDTSLSNEHKFEALSGHLDHLHNTFFSSMTSFIRTHFFNDMTFTVGDNVQVCYSIYPNKLSLHYKFNILFQNVATVCKFVKAYIASLFLPEHIDTLKTLSFYTKNKDGTISSKLAIDTSVYRNFGCVRLLYSTKLREDCPPYILIPYGESSGRIEDHLIVMHPDAITHQNFIHFNLPIMAPNKPIKIGNLHKSIIKKQYSPDDSVKCLIPDNVIENVETLLKTSSYVLDCLAVKNIQFAYSRPSATNPFIYHYWIDHKSTPIKCPYSQRIHSGNRSCLSYCDTDKSVILKCMNDDDCCRKPSTSVQFFMNDEAPIITQGVDFNCHNTLHDRNPLIKWDETFNQSNMKPYPIKDIVCIGASMGQGKTVAIGQLLLDIIKPAKPPISVFDDLENTFVQDIPLAPSAPKCLFITYQRILSRKFLQSFSQFGFDIYLDYTDSSDIYSQQLIICLDSLWRVKTTHFDFVFIDEALSVLLHFQSPLMKNVGAVTAKFQHILMQAKHIYLLDACIDNMMVYNTVKHLENLKNVRAYWIRNENIRKSNRQANLIRNTESKETESLRLSAMTQIIQALAKGKRIVVSSSIKSFTIALVELVKEKLPHIKFVLYNSDTNEDVVAQHAEDLENVWSQYDLLVYSPTIGAGLSFTMAHYHSLIAYTENSYYAPTVDLVLQQLFRVRQLIDGDMTIYVNDLMKWHNLKTETEIASMMDRECDTMCRYCSTLNINSHLADLCTDVAFDGVKYNKNKLSYDIIKGILFMKDKSLSKFADILANTLKTDYNIPITLNIFQGSDALKASAKSVLVKLKPAQIEFAPDLILSDEEYKAKLTIIKTVKKAELTDLEQQQFWTTHMVKDVYKVDPALVDVEFFEKFVGQCQKPNKVKMTDLYFIMQRNALLLNRTKQDIDKKYADELATIFNREDHNFDLFKSKRPAHYQKLYDTYILLSYLLPNESYQEVFLRGEQISIDKDTFFKRLKNFMNGLDYNEYMMIKNRYGIKYKREEILDSNNSCTANAFVKRIIGQCALTCESCTNVKNQKCGDYGTRLIGLSRHWALLYGKFQLSCSSFIETSQYLFFD
jgi:hypothetical protein